MKLQMINGCLVWIAKPAKCESLDYVSKCLFKNVNFNFKN